MEGDFQAVGWIAVLLLAGLILFPVVRAVGRSVQFLTVAYIGFGALAAVAYRPTPVETDGINREIIGYYQTLSVAQRFTFFALAGVCCLAGGALAAAIFRTERVRRPGLAAVQLRPTALWLTVVSLLVLVYGLGPGVVLHSDTYLAHTGPAGALGLSNALTPLGILAAANVWLGGQARSGAKAVAVLLLIATTLVLLGEATREFALVPLLVYAGGLITGRWSKRRAVAYGMITALLAVMLLGVPLFLRGQAELGLVPALKYVFTTPGDFFKSFNPLSNLLLGAPLSTYVAHVETPIPRQALWVSVNPLPGGATSWALWQPILRLNIYEPFSGLGELANHGTAVLAVYMASLGFVFECLEGIALRRTARLAGLLRGVLIGAAGIIFIRSTQYNLRTDTRLVYYTIIIVLFVTLVDSLRAAKLPKLSGQRHKHYQQKKIPSPAAI